MLLCSSCMFYVKSMRRSIAYEDIFDVSDLANIHFHRCYYRDYRLSRISSDYAVYAPDFIQDQIVLCGCLLIESKFPGDTWQLVMCFLSFTDFEAVSTYVEYRFTYLQLHYNLNY